MKNVITIFCIIIIVIMNSCSNVERDNVISTATVPTQESDTIRDSGYSNPAFIYGVSFGEMFQAFYKTGRFEDMIKFTSNGTLKKFGYDKIINFYKSMDFGYNIKLKSETMSGDTIVLNYEAGIVATNTIIRIPIIVENDSCKVFLNKLESFK